MVIGVIEDVVSSQCFRADRDRKRIARSQPAVRARQRSDGERRGDV